MSRKKKILAVMTVLLLFLGDYLYWTCSFSLGQAVPDEDWNRAQLWYYDEFFDAHEVEVDVGLLSEILTLVEKEKVTNRPRFRTMSQPYFMLYVYYEEGYPCSFTIVENGDISIAAELDTEHREYFDGGEELYQALLALVQ